MDKKYRLDDTINKIFKEAQSQYQCSKENYQDVADRMKKMKLDMKKRREQFRLIRNK